MNKELKEKIQKIITTFADYEECEEWHVHDDTGEHEGDTRYSEHKDFDEDQAVDALYQLVVESQISSLKQARNWLKNDEYPVDKIENKISELEGYNGE